MEHLLRMNSMLIPKIVYEYIPSGRRNKHNEGRTIQECLLTSCCAVAAAAAAAADDDDDDAECYCTVTVFYLYVLLIQ
jgi:hypothetical protein